MAVNGDGPKAITLRLSRGDYELLRTAAFAGRTTMSQITRIGTVKQARSVLENARSANVLPDGTDPLPRPSAGGAE